MKGPTGILLIHHERNDMRWILLLSLVTITACSSARPVAFQAPAPEGALSCALAQATLRDFYPIEGGVSGGFLTMARAREYTAGQVASEVGARILSGGLIGSNRLAMEHLTLTGAGGILRVQIIGLDENDKAAKPSAEGLADAEAVLAACSAPSDTL